MVIDSFCKILVSGKACKNKIRCILLIGCLMTLPNLGIASTRQVSRTMLNTQYGTASGINDLAGVDPSADICTTGRPTDNDNKIFYFYNEGSGRFLSIGGLWGTHASINNTPNAIWIEKAGDATYYLNNKIDGSSTGTYVGVKNSNLYMDRSNTVGVFSFEKAQGYTENNKLYRIKVSNSYVTTNPSNPNLLCNIASGYANTDANYKNQVWKIISKAEYYTLALANPATMEALLDFSFLMPDPDFRINNTDAVSWQLGSSGNIDQNKVPIYLGDATMYCTYSKRNQTGQNHFNKYIENHQKNYGKYAYCYSKKLRNFYMYQEVKVHKEGWYVVRCNGFSTQQAVKGEDKPLASLFVAQMNCPEGNRSASTLNAVSAEDAHAMEANSDGAGIDVAFFDGKYENQVQVCVEKGDDGTNPVSSTNPATLRIGFYVAPGTTAVGADEMTAVDNFKLLYAGPRRNPELILDEENTDLKYLTLATDDYTNTVLHLNRKLKDHEWNSFILPVNLTLGQMKRTYGDAVKVAKLDKISGSTVYFVTQEPESDDEVLVKAFEPYIVYPPVVGLVSPSYTAQKFYTSENVDDNSEWLDNNYEKSKDESNALSKTIAANHYNITMVSLDRKELLQHINATKKDNLETWISNTTFSTAAKNGQMTCYGTLAKTYDENGILSGRDDLEEDYCMRDGKLVQVPTGQQYGLKGFRCWFEIKGHEVSTGAKMALNIDGVEDTSTSINDIHGDDAVFTSRGRGIDGVFSLDGQLVRRGSSLLGLPKGIYITNGRKIVVR